MMTKLTVEMRRTIRGRVLTHTFKEKEEALRTKLERIGDAIHEHLVGKSVLDAIATVPTDFLCMFHRAAVRIAGQDCDVPFSGPRPVRMGSFLGVVEGSHRLAEEWTSANSDVRALRASRKAAHAEIGAVLDSVTTLKRLQEVWPECGPFVYGLVAVAASLPAVQIDNLNKSLGLK